MLKYFFALFAFLLVVIISMAGFRGQFSKRPPIEIFPDMDNQPKVKAQTPSKFFADNRSARLPVEETVPLGYSIPLRDAAGAIVEMQGPYKQIAFSGPPDYYNTGKIGDQWGTGLPIVIDDEIMQRGRERFNISCRVCHGAVGLGNGVAGEFGLNAIANLHQERLVEMADGEIFNTITNGKNTMLGYGHNIQVPDRWAIVAYLRALQRSRRVPADQLPPAELSRLQSGSTDETPAESPAADAGTASLNLP